MTTGQTWIAGEGTASGGSGLEGSRAECQGESYLISGFRISPLPSSASVRSK